MSLSFSSLRPRERAAALAALVLASLLAVDRLAVRPWLSASADLEERIAVKEARLRRAQTLLAGGERLRREHRDLIRRKDAAAGLEDGTALVKEAESLARLAGVRIRDVRREESNSRDRRTAEVAVTVESPWPPLARYLYELHRSPSVLIDKAHMRSHEDDGAVTATLHLRRQEIQ